MEQKKAKRTEEETEQRKEQRFVIQDRQSFPGGTLWVVIDTQNGVNYLISGGMGLSGMMPLVDEKGKVMVSKEYLKPKNKSDEPNGIK